MLTSFQIIAADLIQLTKQSIIKYTLGMDQSENLVPITKRFSYDKTKFIGKGSYGSVYQGIDHQKQKKIAVKIYHDPNGSIEEAKVLEKLSSLIHPNIVQYHGYEKARGQAYLFLQYCPNGSLTSLIEKGISEEQALNLFQQIVEGMCYINVKGFIHRDFKPDNILIGQNHQIKISDFGLARLNGGPDISHQVGTKLYASPQVYLKLKEAYNQRCDVWSTGLILYQMLTGHHPLEKMKKFGNLRFFQLKQQWKEIEEGKVDIKLGPSYHPKWQHFINLMLTYNPALRPSFQQILRILKPLNSSMAEQIRNRSQQHPRAEIELYLIFLDGKLSFLSETAAELIRSKNIFDSECIKYIHVFLISSLHVTALQEIKSDLRQGVIKYPNGEQEMSSSNQSTALVMKKYCSLFAAKLAKSEKDIRQKIVPEICDRGRWGKKEEKLLEKDLKSTYQLVEAVKDDCFDSCLQYQKEYLHTLKYFNRENMRKLNLNEINQQDLRLYLRLFLIGFFNTEFPAERFRQESFLSKRWQAISSSTAKMREQIALLSKKL